MQPSASGGTAHCRWCTDATVDQFDDAIATVAVGLSGDSVMPPTWPLRDENQAQKALPETAAARGRQAHLRQLA
jgi:hypothetical protein